MQSRAFIASLVMSSAFGLSTQAYALDVDFSDIYSRGNIDNALNNTVVYTINDAGFDAYIQQIDFDASVLANSLLFLGTAFNDLSVQINYTHADGSNLTANLGFDLANTDLIPTDTPAVLMGTLESVAGSGNDIANWRIKTGGVLTFAFYEEVDDANFDALTGSDYWDAKWQTGSTLTLVTNPVPEPETYAMMLAGLGLLGLMARRRVGKV